MVASNLDSFAREAASFDVEEREYEQQQDAAGLRFCWNEPIRLISHEEEEAG
jgi:hypothetical protein